jgi:hypothetical protein
MERDDLERMIWKNRCTWEDTIEMNLQEVGRGGMDWINLGRDRNK